ncbi:hypothetical protein IKP85_04910 [bacterium]|nr:hypothetical protein [bacterium]
MTKIQLRRAISAQWRSSNPKLLLGEFGLETDTMRFKIGDGEHFWNDLEYSIPTKTSDLDNDSGYINLSSVPTRVSQLINDSEYIDDSALLPYVLSANLSDVATTGDYDDLVNKPLIPAAQVNSDWNASDGVAEILNKPTIPTVNNATLTIQKNGTNVGTFTANASNNVTANISVPTDTGDLTNGAGFITSSALSGYVQSTDLAEVATSGSYSDLSNKPAIPAAQVNSDWNASGGVSQILNKPTIPIVNNATLTIQKNGTNVGTFTANASTDKTINITVPTNTNELTNGAGYITGITSSDVTTALGYTPYNSSNPNGYTSNTGTVTSVNNVSPVSGNVTLSIPTTASDIGAQEALVSGTNIKTINNTSILGSGNIDIAADNIFIAVYDSTSYADVEAAYNAGKTIFAKYNPIAVDNRIYILTGYTIGFQFTRITGSSLQTLTLDPVIGWEISSVSINNKTLTIQKNGMDVATFTANSPSDVTANITVPTNTNELTNGAGFITSSALSGYVQSTDLATVATSGSYNDLNNKPTIPAAQVQSDWNETNTSSKAYILNKPTIPAGVVVDQTYNGTSANAQSGVAITGAGFIQNTATGDYSLELLGSTSNTSRSIAVGYDSFANEGSTAVGTATGASGNGSSAFGWASKASGSRSTAIGSVAKATATDAIQIGAGTNSTAKSLQIGFNGGNIGAETYSYMLLDGTTGLIPDARLSSNIARTSQLPSAVTETTVSGWGFTKNTGTVTSVNNVSPVNGNVSLTIPTVNNATLTIQKNGTTVKTFTANASSNVTCNITVPTKTSDLTNDSSFVTTDTQDTCGASNTTEKIYLVGRTAQSTGTSNSNSSVYTENGYLYAKTPSASSNTTSVATTKWVTDKGYTSNVGTVTSVNSTSPDANGNVSITIPTVPTNISAFTNDSGYITGITSSNVTTALGYTPADTDLSNLSATGKTVLDGQWVINEQQIYSGSLNSSTALDKTVTLPNDNHIYEVLISGEVETGTTSGNLIAVILKSNILTKYASVCAARTRASSSVASRGSIIIPMKYGSNNLTIYRGTGYNGTATIYSVAYRRCGTNT